MNFCRMEENGQIAVNTEFGYNIYLLGKDSRFAKYLEVGTWKGNGTTKCLMEGIIERKEEGEKSYIDFFSFESNLVFYMEALQLWIPKGYPFLNLIWGKLHKNGLLTENEITTSEQFGAIKEHYDLWYEQDKIDYEKTPYIRPDFLHSEFDVLILDGGEFSGYADWEVLRDKNPKVVCLDDINTMKNSKVYYELSSDLNWKKIAGSNDRNGWAIFEHISLNNQK